MPPLSVLRDDGALGELRPLVLALRDHHAAVAPEFGPVRDDDACWVMTRDRYARALAAGDGALFVARGAGGPPLGFAFASAAAPSPDWPTVAVVVEDIAVAADARGVGLGAGLLAAVRAHAGDRELRLSVLEANHGARRFYAREGFVGLARELVLLRDH